MENVRVTKGQKFDAIIKYLETGETTEIPAQVDKGGTVIKLGITIDVPTMVEFCKAEKELLKKKSSSGEKKLTDNQENNKLLANAILEYLANIIPTDEKPGATCAEMVKNIPEFADGDFTVSKVSSILRVNLKEQISYTVKKGKKYFSLA